MHILGIFFNRAWITIFESMMDSDKWSHGWLVNTDNTALLHFWKMYLHLYPEIKSVCSAKLSSGGDAIIKCLYNESK